MLKIAWSDDDCADSVGDLEEPGSEIGNYVLVEKIGEGGMGTVWKARQTEPLQRVVALKIIKLGMDTHEVVKRFQSERQALAVMSHPNIAAVFDAGATASGRPYFVMELVAGVPITEFCASHRLSLGERLNLFQQVCSAVQHAHSKGIIHRDLKPTNIIAAEGSPQPLLKVIDFGIAKAVEPDFLDRTQQHTLGGQIIGTPGYMSPEQAGATADVDVRADIYALGALLYELVAGTPPLEERELRKAGFAEILRIIREEDPPKPSSRAEGTSESLVRGKLDNIVMKAIARDRDQRFDTVTDLSDEIDRFLAGKSAPAPEKRSPAVLVGLLVTIAAIAIIAFAVTRDWGAADGGEEITALSEDTANPQPIPAQTFAFSPGDAPGLVEVEPGGALLQRDGVALPMMTSLVGNDPAAVIRVPGEWNVSEIAGISPAVVGAKDKAPARVSHQLAWFPFSEGWLGGHLRIPRHLSGADAQNPAEIEWLGSSEIRVTAEGAAGTDREFHIEIESVDSRSSGLLFAISAGAMAGDPSLREIFIPILDPDGVGGWFLRTAASIGHARQEAYFTNSRDLSLVFVPWDTEGLVGGSSRTDMQHAESIGDFEITTQGTGRWRLQVPGSEGGTLLLKPAQTAARVAHLSQHYVASGSYFEIELRDLTTGKLSDGDWFFALLPAR